MNLQPLYEATNELNAGLSRLNQNLETWIGLVAAANSAGGEPVETKPAAPEAPAAEPAAPAAEKVERRGRPKKVRYWYDNSTQRLEEAVESPGAEFVELTKTKYDEVKAKLAAPAAPVAPAPAPAPAPAATPSDDPFADDAPAAGAVTLEAVREIAFKVRDKFGTDKAKALIAKYAVKLDQIPAERYAEFVNEADALLGTSDL